MKARLGSGKSVEIDENKVRAEGRSVKQAARAAYGVSTAPAPIFLPKQVWFMPGPLPGMNDFISTGNRFRYATAKKKWHKLIAEQIQKNGLAPMQRVFFRFTWHEQHKRRNPDNITSLGKKFLFDALQEAGILGNDGWKQIDGWEDRWLVNAASPGVMIEMEEVDPW